MSVRYVQDQAIDFNCELRKKLQSLVDISDLLEFPFNLNFRSIILPAMSSLPPVYIIASARTPLGAFQGSVLPKRKFEVQLTEIQIPFQSHSRGPGRTCRQMLVGLLSNNRP